MYTSKTKNIIILLLITLVICILMDIGYAKSTNAAVTSGVWSKHEQFNIQFENAEVINAIGVNEENTYAKLSHDKKSLYLNISDLYYPGARVEFSVNIVNRGNIAAKLNSISTRGLEDSFLRITGLEKINDNEEILDPNEIYTINFTVEWDSNYKVVKDQKINFGLDLNYEQEI